MSATIYKTLRAQPVLAVGGEGVWLYGADGKRYLDTCGGVCVSSLGHRHPRMRAALAREADHLAWAHAGSFTSEPAEELAHFLVGRSGGMARAQFLSGGSEAMELALKTAYQYHCERGEPSRTVFIARRRSYHGSTLGTLAVSGNPERRSIFEPLLPRATFVSPCFSYREMLPGETEALYVARLARELDAKIGEIGEGRVAAFIAEPVVGSTAGAVPALNGYFRAIAEVCKRHNVLLILDDVMSGMGRTGYLFSHIEDGIVPDLVAIGKGLAAGYQPISGLLVGQRVYDALDQGSGVLRNGQTHVNHPFACAIALEVQRVIEDNDLLGAVHKQGRYLRAKLEHSLGQFEFVGDVRGRGLFLGVELVADRSTKAPLGAPGLVTSTLKSAALDHGMLIYPSSGTIDGERGNHILFAPPFIITAAEIDELVDRFVFVLQLCRPLIEQQMRVAAAA